MCASEFDICTGSYLARQVGSGEALLQAPQLDSYVVFASLGAKRPNCMTISLEHPSHNIM